MDLSANSLEGEEAVDTVLYCSLAEKLLDY